jgi:hypothetical protein
MYLCVPCALDAERTNDAKDRSGSLKRTLICISPYPAVRFIECDVVDSWRSLINNERGSIK